MTTESTAPTRRRISIGRVLVLLSWLFSLGFVAAGTWSNYWADLRNDQYQLINLGQCVYDGGRMYVDCWENKPPGIAWLNALGIALSGGARIGAWVLPGVTLLLCLVVMGWTMWQVLSPAASTAAVLLGSIITTLRLYDTPSINPDFYSGMFELLAGSLWLAALCTPRTPRRIGLALLAGLAWAAAAAVKQTGCVGLLAVTLLTLFLAAFKQSDRNRWALTGGLAWAGFAVGLGGVVSVLAYRETLGPAWEAVFGFNRGLLAWPDLAEAVTAWLRQRAGLEPVQLGLLLALLGTVATLRAGKARGASSAVVIALLLWWVVQVLLALLGPSRSMRYWQATWPAMLWLAGVGFLHLETLFYRTEKGSRAALAVISVALLLFLGRPLVDHYKHGLATSYLACSEENAQRERVEEIGRQLMEIVPQGQRIYVWGYDAGIYLYASRRPASRFAYPRSERQMQEILADLAAGKAYAIIVPHARPPCFDRWCDEPCYEKLSEVLTRYEASCSSADYDVWRRLDSASLRESARDSGAPSG